MMKNNKFLSFINKLKLNNLFYPFLVTSILIISSIIFIIFAIIYNQSIDYQSYQEALKNNPNIDISNFYKPYTIIMYFIAFYFLMAMIVSSILTLLFWIKWIVFRYHKNKKVKNNE